MSRSNRTPDRAAGTKATYLGIAVALLGGVFCVFGIYMWGLSGGGCDTSCGHGYVWLLYFTVPGAVLAAAGLTIRGHARRGNRESDDRGK
jgi:hypothetical protein